MSGSYNLGDKNSGFGSIDFSKLKSGIKFEELKDDTLRSLFMQIAGDDGILDREEIKNLENYLAGTVDADNDGTITDNEGRKANTFGDNTKTLGKEGREQLLKLLKTLSGFTTGIDKVISGKNDKNNKNNDVLETVYYSDGREEIVYKNGKKEVITEKDGYTTTTYFDENGTSTQTIETDNKGNKTFKDGNGDIVKKEFITDKGKQIQEFKDGQIYKITTTTDGVTSEQTFNDDNTYTMQVTRGGKTEEYISTTGSNTEDTYVPENERTVTRNDETRGEIVETFVDWAINKQTGEYIQEYTQKEIEDGIVEFRFHEISSQTIKGRTVKYGYDKDGNIYTKGIIVQNAETITDLARTFGVSPQDLIKANRDKLHKSGGTYWFKVGAEIVIPGQIEADNAIWETRVSHDDAVAEFNRDWRAKQERIRKEQEEQERIQSEEQERIAAEQEERAQVKAQKEQKRAKMDDVAKQFYEASQKINRENMAKMISLAKNNVNADNVLEFIMAFDKVNGEEGDDIVAAITSAGISSLRVKHEDRKELLNHLIDTLCKRAINAGVNKYDVQRLQNNFRASLNAEYKKVGTVDSTNMDTIIKTLVSLINVQENKPTEEYEESSVMAFVAVDFKAENQTAQETFEEARKNEGWITRNASNVRFFSSTTIEELRAVLGDNADKVDWLNNLAKLLENPPSEEERVRLTKLYEQTYFELFGIEYNPDNITAFEEYYERVYNASLSKAAGEILSDIKEDISYDSLLTQLKNKLKLDDSALEALVNQIIEQNPEFEINTDEDKKTLLLAYFEGISEEYDSLTNGDTLEEMAQKLESLSRAAFGTNQIGDKVAEFNKDMVTTMIASEAAAEILGTIIVSWIPVVGEAAMAKLAVSATKWGAKGVKFAKLARMASKAEKGFKVATKIQKGTKFSSKLATKAGQAGYAMATTGIATLTVDLSDKRSVKETLSKTLMNMSFAGVGSASSMLAPKLMKSFGIVDKALANEIAEEIINAAGSWGIVTITGGKYGEEDAYIDFITGLIISRLSHVNSPKTTTPKVNKSRQDITLPTKPQEALITPQQQQPKTPILDKASYNPAMQGDIAPAGAVRGKLSPENVSAIRQEIESAINNPKTTPEQLAELRKKLDALGIENNKLRNELQGKLDEAAANRPADEVERYNNEKSANLQDEINRLFSKKDATYGDTETRLFLEYLDELNTEEEIEAFKKQLHDKTHTGEMKEKGDNSGSTVHRNKDKLCSMTDADYKAVIDKADAKIAEIKRVNANAARSAQEKHDHVIKLLSQTDGKGNPKGISTADLKEINDYIASVTDHRKLDEIAHALNNNKKIGINERKMIKDKIKAQKEAHPLQPKPAESQPKSQQKSEAVEHQSVVKPTKAYSEMNEAELLAEYERLINKINSEPSVEANMDNVNKLREELLPELKKKGYDIDFKDNRKLIRKDGEPIKPAEDAAPAEGNPKPDGKPEPKYQDLMDTELAAEYHKLLESRDLSSKTTDLNTESRINDMRIELERRGYDIKPMNEWLADIRSQYPDAIIEHLGKDLIEIKEINPRTNKLTKSTVFDTYTQKIRKLNEFDPVTGHYVKETSYNKGVAYKIEYSDPVTGYYVKETYIKNNKVTRTIEYDGSPEKRVIRDSAVEEDGLHISDDGGPEVEIESESAVEHNSEPEIETQPTPGKKSYADMDVDDLFDEYQGLKNENKYGELSRSAKADNVKEMKKIEAILEDEGYEIRFGELKAKKNSSLIWDKQIDETGRTVSKTRNRLFKKGTITKEYDASGNVSKIVYKDKYGEPAIIKEYDTGKLTREITYYIYDNGYYSIKKYKDGKLSRSEEYYHDKLSTETTYFTNGKKSTEIRYSIEDNKPYAYEEYSNGKLLVDEVNNSDGTVSRTRYESDGETPSVTTIFSDADNYLTKSVIEYKNGVKHKEISYAEDGKTPIHELTYGEDGKSVIGEVVLPGQGKYITYEIDNYDNIIPLFAGLKDNITCTSGTHSKMGTTGAAREAGTIHSINNKEVKITYQNGNTYISYMHDKANGAYYVLKFDGAIPEAACKNFLEHWDWRNLSYGDAEVKAQQQMNKCINRHRKPKERVSI